MEIKRHVCDSLTQSQGSRLTGVQAMSMTSLGTRGEQASSIGTPMPHGKGERYVKDNVHRITRPVNDNVADGPEQGGGHAVAVRAVFRVQSVCNVPGYCRLITPMCDGQASRIGFPSRFQWCQWCQCGCSVPNGNLTRSNHAASTPCKPIDYRAQNRANGKLDGRRWLSPRHHHAISAH